MGASAPTSPLRLREASEQEGQKSFFGALISKYTSDRVQPALAFKDFAAPIERRPAGQL